MNFNALAAASAAAAILIGTPAFANTTQVLTGYNTAGIGSAITIKGQSPSGSAGFSGVALGGGKASLTALDSSFGSLNFSVQFTGFRDKTGFNLYGIDESPGATLYHNEVVDIGISALSGQVFPLGWKVVETAYIYTGAIPSGNLTSLTLNATYLSLLDTLTIDHSNYLTPPSSTLSYTGATLAEGTYSIVEELQLIRTSGTNQFGAVAGTTVNGTVTAVPEASTWAMMMVGFAGLAFAGYRGSRSRRSAFAG
jgi:hypothetical protein